MAYLVFSGGQKLRVEDDMRSVAIALASAEATPQWTVMQSGDEKVFINPAQVACIVEDDAYQRLFGQRGTPFVTP